MRLASALRTLQTDRDQAQIRAGERCAVAEFFRAAIAQARAHPRAPPWPQHFECSGEHYRLVGTNFGRLMILNRQGEALAASGYGALEG